MVLARRIVVGVALATSAAGVALVGHHEGFRKQAYRDPVGIVTVCYGHTGTARMGQSYSKEACQALLQSDLRAAEAAVRRLVKVPLTQETFDALVSFTFNVGEGNFAKSNLLRKLNAGDYEGACRELSRWIYARGQILPGLITRRKDEKHLCLSGLQ
jgi:lysozyme